MLDVLVYLFQQYFHQGWHADENQLQRQLAAAGFANDDIHQALDWLSDLEGWPGQQVAWQNPQATSLRLYHQDEQQRLCAQSLSYLMFLEQSGNLSAQQRELVLHKLMHLPVDPIDLHHTKMVALIVLWAVKHPLDVLLVEELLSSQASQTVH